MIIQIRVDDRLIHRQIAVVWPKYLAANHLVVANDQVAKSEIQQVTLKMVTPNGVKILTRSVDDVIKVFNNLKSETVKMLVLTNNIQDALKIATNYKMELINVANIGRFETASEKKQLNADVGCTPKELGALKEITKLDMEAIHWVIPTNPKISVKKLLENNQRRELNMLSVALLSALSCLICYAGNWMFGQSISDRPTFIGVVIELLLRDLQQGLIIGATPEAVFTGSVSIGGQISAGHSAATISTVAFATNATLDPEAALTIAVPVGILMGFVTMFVDNTFPTVFTTSVDRWALEGNEGGPLICLNSGIWLARNPFFVAIVFFGVYVDYNATEVFVSSTPDVIITGLTVYGQLPPAVGLVLLIETIWTKEIGIYYLPGFVMSIYTKLPTIVIVVIDVVIMVATAMCDFEINRMKQHPTTCADKNDSDEEPEDSSQ